MIGYAVILIAVISAVKSNDECGGFEVFDECLKLAEPLTLKNMEELPGKDFLDKHCSPTIKILECLRDELQKCPALAEFIFETVSSINSYLDLLHSICDDDSALRKGYMENVGCYNMVLPQMFECSNSSKKLVNDFVTSIMDEPEVEGMISSDCLLMPLLFSCVIQETAKVCGDEATDPLSSILNQATSITKESGCPEEDVLTEWEARFILFVSAQALELKK